MQEFFEYEIDNIESIECIGEIENYMYDIGMEDSPHTFFANDILVHNSLFLSALPILEKMNIDLSNTDLAINETVKIATNVQNYINELYSKFTTRNLFVKDHKLKIKQENVASAGIWLAKKRYALWMILKEGSRVNKLAVTGIDVVRSDFPKLFQNSLSKILSDILTLKSKTNVNKILIDMKNNMKKEDIYKVMFNKGVKGIEDYSINRPGLFKHVKGATAQAKAAINHNDFLKYKNIVSDEIRSNSKIKWTYLVKNPYNLESIALKGYEDPQELVDYTKMYLDYERVFYDGFVSKVQDFYDAANWDIIQLNENVDKFFIF